mmetsp:Transcript_4538/g.5213  ORF Transcript_4538/g.5213 Transcript_4538/m.5213 type:complete len:98 (-) Transcript_4538:93-386(-)
MIKNINNNNNNNNNLFYIEYTYATTQYYHGQIVLRAARQDILFIYKKQIIMKKNGEYEIYPKHLQNIRISIPHRIFGYYHYYYYYYLLLYEGYKCTQ